MSENKIQRRRFLADLLFGGGVLSAAALLAQSAEAKTPPKGTPSPSPSPTRSPETPGPERRIGGIAAPPQKPPAPPTPPKP